MEFETYKAKRAALIEEAQALLKAGDIAKAKEKREEVEQLDETFEASAREQANIAALEKPPIVAGVAGQSAKGALHKFDQMGGMGETDDKAQANLYKTAFAKAIMGRTLADEEKTCFAKVNDAYRAATQTTEEHGVLVPETVKAGIWQEIGEMHPVLNDLSKTFVHGDLTIIKDDDVTEDAEWIEEKDDSPEGETKESTISLTGCELSRTITVSWKLRKMAIDEFLTYITNKIAVKMGNALAKAIFHGKGKPGESDSFKPQARGIVTALDADKEKGQIVEYTAASGIAYKTVTTALAKVKSGYLSKAVIYARNEDIWNLLANIVDGQKRPIFVPDPTGAGVGRLFGLPVKEEDGVLEGEIVIGNVARGYVLNVNENITMYKEEHVKQRKTDYTGYGIADGDVLSEKAFVVIRKETLAGA